MEDLRRINLLSVRAKRVGMIVLGGGLVKHHIANACLMRNGAERAVFVNTGQEFDGSDAGARPDEAVSWGKIRADGESVKASVLLRYLVSIHKFWPVGLMSCRSMQMQRLSFHLSWLLRLQGFLR